MGYLSWFEGLRVGVDEIDTQHQKLINLINQLYQTLQQGAPSNKIEEVLKELIAYADYHFRAEEEYMRKLKYPYFKFHLREHEKFREKLSELVESKDSITKIGFDVFLFLKEWLIKHIIAVDKKIKLYDTKNG